MKKTPKENPKSYFLQFTIDLATSSHHSPSHHPSSATHLHPFSTLIFKDRGKKTKAKSHLPSLLLKTILPFPPQVTIHPPLFSSFTISQLALC
jgi:hypothetical protein